MKKLILLSLMALFTISCSAMGPLRIRQIILDPIACETSELATVEINAAGGTPPYSFQINVGPSQSSNVFENIEAGEHVFTVFDQDGNSNAVSVNVGPSVFSRYTLTLAGSCDDVEEGIISVAIEGGVDPVLTSLAGNGQNQLLQGSGSFEPIPAGEYDISSTDSGTAPCSPTSFVVNFVLPGEFVAITEAESTPRDCTTGEGGTITITAEGGTLPYEFSLVGPDDRPFQSSNIFLDLASGEYTAIVRDVDGCTDSLSGIEVDFFRSKTGNAKQDFAFAKYCADVPC